MNDVEERTRKGGGKGGREGGRKSAFRGYFLWYLLSQSPPARIPLPRVRKPNLHSDRGQDSNPCAWRPPSEPIARMVPLYHGGS
ncbi:hypothetical protein E2C01_076286 [Portunus trituberculatus]|uniref:Uncharacterized protein n=1 Tax=Portunus trituberculatus TaxID=210409 RepID=A0A5B7ILM2_PORTR|nr:hypothetical protein [Portunus trituberculatus]